MSSAGCWRKLQVRSRHNVSNHDRSVLYLGNHWQTAGTKLQGWGAPEWNLRYAPGGVRKSGETVSVCTEVCAVRCLRLPGSGVKSAQTLTGCWYTWDSMSRFWPLQHCGFSLTLSFRRALRCSPDPITRGQLWSCCSHLPLTSFLLCPHQMSPLHSVYKYTRALGWLKVFIFTVYMIVFFFTFSKHHELEFFVTIIIFVVEYVYISHTFTKCFIHDPILSNDTATALILMKR